MRSSSSTSTATRQPSSDRSRAVTDSGVLPVSPSTTSRAVPARWPPLAGLRGGGSADALADLRFLGGAFLVVSCRGAAFEAEVFLAGLVFLVAGAFVGVFFAAVFFEAVPFSAMALLPQLL